MSMKRQIRAMTAPEAKLRTAKLYGREHLVVPVVALVPGVVHASNAEKPELVTIEVIEKAPGGWNGRPVLPNHPETGTANVPETLQSEAFGVVFNSRTQDSKLLMEAWLDTTRAKEVGSLAEDVIHRALAGEPIEVSVGAYVTLEEKHGEYDGKEYFGVWSEVVPDHLAMLEAGARGACSNKMGCGAPRLASGKKSLRERLLEMMGFRNSESEGLSDSEIYRALDKTLYAEEPGYLGIDNVFQSENRVVYAVAPDDKLVLYRREFSVDEKGAVTLGEKEEVTMVTRYEPIALSAPCNCNKSSEDTMDKTKMVSALIECPKTKFTEADRAGLEALSITALEGLMPPAETEKPTEPKEEKAVELTPEQVEALLPEETKQLLARVRTAEANKKIELVKTLAENQTAFDKAELEAMDIAMLEKLSKVAPVKREADFSGRGVPRTAEENKGIPSAPSLSEQFTK